MIVSHHVLRLGSALDLLKYVSLHHILSPNDNVCSDILSTNDNVCSDILSTNDNDCSDMFYLLSDISYLITTMTDPADISVFYPLVAIAVLLRRDRNLA